MTVSAAMLTFLKWLGVDMAGDVIWKGLKEASSAIMEAFKQDATGTISSTVVDRTLEAFKRLLPPTEDDELVIKEGLDLLPVHHGRDARDIKEAWFDIVNSFDDPLNPEEGRRQKEYYRRYVAGESPYKTMVTIVNHAGMDKPLLDKFKLALDVKFKADEKAVNPLMDWVKTKGSTIGSVLGARRTELDTKFKDTATEMRSWREQRRINRGQV